MFNTQYLYNCQVILFNYDSAKLSIFGTCNISHRYITYIYFQITITLAPSTLATYSSTIGTNTIYRGTISPLILMKYYISLYKGRLVVILHTTRESRGRYPPSFLKYGDISDNQVYFRRGIPYGFADRPLIGIQYILLNSYDDVSYYGCCY